LAPRKSLGRRN